MFNLFDIFKKNRKWDFHGGIFPPEMKEKSSGVPLRAIPLPKHFIIPIKQHVGQEGVICITPGDQILKGQPLTVGQGSMLPVHAPTSGSCKTIKQHIIPHPSGLEELCVFMEADGQDRWYQRDPVIDYHKLSPQDFIRCIHNAGISGLGGAGFPTSRKLQGSISNIDTLIINAAECEPYITSDDRLIQDHADQIIQGIQILRHFLQPKITLIGIENNKLGAISAFNQALHSQPDIILRVIPTKYPSGAAKQLIKILTGKEIPHGQHSSNIGILMQNVATVFAIKRAIINGEPLIERVVTITGNALSNPGNLWVRIGTPVQHLLDFSGFQPQYDPIVVMGGPLMGFRLSTLNVPVIKTSNCILAMTPNEISSQGTEYPCIRCGLCVDVCPVGLLPQQLYWFIRSKEHEKARQYNLSDCIECGACAFVCPSKIPLVQCYLQGKAEIKAINNAVLHTAEAKIRYERKLARLENEKLLREQRQHNTIKKITKDDQNSVQCVLEFKKNKKNTIATTMHENHMNSCKINLTSEARNSQDGAYLINNEKETEIASPTALKLSEQIILEIDHRKSEVAAAIARAKVKKVSLDVLSIKINEKKTDLS